MMEFMMGVGWTLAAGYIIYTAKPTGNNELVERMKREPLGSLGNVITQPQEKKL